MERAARIVNASKATSKILNEDELARAVWPSAVGRVIASHTSRIRVVRNTLVVEVADATWQKQLFGLSHQILDRVRQVGGNRGLTEIEFRVAVPRRDPQRADGSRSSLFGPEISQDDAEQILDPVLKKVYRMSRRKASA